MFKSSVRQKRLKEKAYPLLLKGIPLYRKKKARH